MTQKDMSNECDTKHINLSIFVYIYFLLLFPYENNYFHKDFEFFFVIYNLM
jgi:hypothetical protein